MNESPVVPRVTVKVGRTGSSCLFGHQEHVLEGGKHGVEGQQEDIKPQDIDGRGPNPHIGLSALHVLVLNVGKVVLQQFDEKSCVF